MIVNTKTVIENRVNVEFTEYEACVIAFLVGKIGGAHEFRKVTSPLYHELIRSVGQGVYDKFFEKNRDAVEEGMFLKSEEWKSEKYP